MGMPEWVQKHRRRTGKEEKKFMKDAGTKFFSITSRYTDLALEALDCSVKLLNTRKLSKS